MYIWDEAKAINNLAKHGVAFEAVYDFDWDTAYLVEDSRFDYGEQRSIAFGLIGEDLHVLVYTVRDDLVRVISLRRANRRERTLYGKAQSP
ncbi:BrnT family toxin [Inquilinus limosus]|uniref:BrnT family toxin n=1 Tax=Inquilinus limosus TaxID=171674 RepID=UPI003F140A40